MRNRITTYQSSKRGYYHIADKFIFFRSSYEPIFAFYLETLKSMSAIKSWEYECETFWFDNIKRGVRSYKPDFKIVNNDDTIIYYEVKGWNDPKSKTKAKRMKKYYPEIMLEIIDGAFIKKIKKQFTIPALIPIKKEELPL